MIISTLSSYLPIFLLFTATISNASTINFPKRSKVFKRNNINKYYGCDANQQSFITQAYKDALKLADNVSPFLPVRDELFAPGQDPGPLEIRYFGADIAPSNDAKPALIRSMLL